MRQRGRGKPPSQSGQHFRVSLSQNINDKSVRTLWAQLSQSGERLGRICSCYVHSFILHVFSLCTSCLAAQFSLACRTHFLVFAHIQVFTEGESAARRACFRCAKDARTYHRTSRGQRCVAPDARCDARCVRIVQQKCTLLNLW